MEEFHQNYDHTNPQGNPLFSRIQITLSGLLPKKKRLSSLNLSQFGLGVSIGKKKSEM